MGALIRRGTIAGVGLTPLKEIADERGAVLRMLRADEPDFSVFGECYFSQINPGATKAWKRHQRQTQLLAVPIGKIRLVIYDDRPESPSSRTAMTLHLGRPDAYVRVCIPPGLWYGFMCLGEQSALVANCTDIPHDPDECDVRSTDHPEAPCRWDFAIGSE